jgi:diguanylate cyclase (GGDEF)-like protein
LAGVLLGAAAVVAATGIRVLLTPIAGGDMALILYVLAVMLAAYVGGAVAGISTTLLSLGLGVTYIIGAQALMTTPLAWARVLVFSVEGVTVSLMMETPQRRTAVLRETTAELRAERERVEHLALADPLTDLGNRRAFDRSFARAVAQSARHGTVLTLVFADVNGLKHTNDELGHTVGDQLLVAVGSAIHECCRASDQAFRVGGDEFAVLLPDIDRDGYASLQARMEAVLREVCATYGSTGVSFGAAHIPEDGDACGPILHLADRRMYDDKTRSGAA